VGSWVVGRRYGGWACGGGRPLTGKGQGVGGEEAGRGWGGRYVARGCAEGWRGGGRRGGASGE